MENNKTVWTVIYTHRYGTDVLACESEKSAWLSVVEIMLEWIDEFDDEEVQLKLVELLRKGNYAQAGQLWSENNEDEYFEVDNVPLLTEPKDILESLENKWRELSQ